MTWADRFMLVAGAALATWLITWMGTCELRLRGVRVKMNLENIDKVKPVLREDEVLCSGCWAVEKKTVTGWIYTKFAHLEAVTLCPDCQYKFGDDFEKLLKAGL